MSIWPFNSTEQVCQNIYIGYIAAPSVALGVSDVALHLIKGRSSYCVEIDFLTFG